MIIILLNLSSPHYLPIVEELASPPCLSWASALIHKHLCKSNLYISQLRCLVLIDRAMVISFNLNRPGWSYWLIKYKAHWVVGVVEGGGLRVRPHLSSASSSATSSGFCPWDPLLDYNLSKVSQCFIVILYWGSCHPVSI